MVGKMSYPKDVAALRNGDVDLVRRDFSNENFVGLDIKSRDMQDADLQRLNLVECNLSETIMSGSKISGMQAGNCNFQSAILERTSIYSVNFTDCDMRGMAFNMSHFNKVIFSGCDLRGAGFRISTFADALEFIDCIVDEHTDFTGAKIGRELADNLIFAGWEVERGQLRRVVDGGEDQRVSPSAPNTVPINDGNKRIFSNNIRSQAPEVFVSLRNIQVQIASQIGELQGNKPNDPERLSLYLQNIEFLTSVFRDLDAACDDIQEYTETKVDAPIVSATERLWGLGSQLSRWMLEKANDHKEHAVQVIVIGGATAFLTMCGAPGLAAVGLAATIIRGPKFWEDAKGIMKGVGGGKAEG